MNEEIKTLEEKTPETTIDYAKLADIIEKRQKNTENSIIKSYMKEIGMNDEEAKQALQDFQRRKTEKQQQETDAIDNMKKELETLKTEKKQAKVERQIKKAMDDCGIAEKKYDVIKKLINIETIDVEDEKKYEESVKNEIVKILEILPELKTQEKKQIGIHIEKGTQGNQDNEALAKIFGNKK